MSYCRLCEADPIEASKRGAYLKRVNPKGVAGIWECEPACEGEFGDSSDAVLRAVDDSACKKEKR